ncbi:MAG TPA: DUF3810 domain-containing protein [Panacibacter sp.]|nr:DUF3810 domain-containing protein [Panacibacter sp.]HNP43445.1 DUF3810 domain-containing protein [Panacibacter sp.]
MKKDGKKVTKKSLAWFLFIFLFAIVINVFSYFPAVVEAYYSGKIYPVISVVLRLVTGWIPFSIGDILYTLAGAWMAVRLFKTVAAVIKRRVSVQTFLYSFYRTIFIALWVYFVFNVLWGLNYNRLGIAFQLKLDPKAYNEADVKNLTQQLVQKVNEARRSLGDSTFAYPDAKEIFLEADEAYAKAYLRYPFLNYTAFSIKSSLYGWLGNYTGFLGYYDPFSGEAQVNTTVPAFVIPYTACHEIGHQLGYGSEDEANFSGYLAAVSSDKRYFRYSAYFDLFAYSNSKLFMMDSLLAKEQYKSLDTLVKKDFSTYRKFLAEHRNPVEPYISLLYGKYLQANNQPKGLDTYDEVIGWLIAYEKKYGKL